MSVRLCCIGVSAFSRLRLDITHTTHIQSADHIGVCRCRAEIVSSKQRCTVAAATQEIIVSVGICATITVAVKV